MRKIDSRWYQLINFFIIVTAVGAKCPLGEELIAKWFGLQTLLKGCPPMSWKNGLNRQEFLDSFSNCIQKKTFVAIDALLAEDVIPLVNGIDFIRYEIVRKNATDSHVHPNQIINSESRKETGSSEESQNSSIIRDWRDKLLVRFARIFRTHVMKVDIERMFSGKSLPEDNEIHEFSRGYGVQGRGRRRRKHGHTMSMAMMGVLLMGSVLIPMGFQFLAVLGGKALILAKMALMLSSIQGLKRIATNGVNYGLYHTHDPWHERSGLTEDLPQLDMNPYQHLSYTLPRP